MDSEGELTPVARVVLVAAFVSAFAPISSASANRKAKEMVGNAVSEQIDLLARFPALTQIDGVIRSDCAANNNGKDAKGEFCGCAAAITMGLWRTGVDPKMVPRLQTYLEKPTEDGAAEFLKYQGPELYVPICTEATER